VRFRIVSIASSIACGVTSGTWGVGWPSYMSSTPPLRSSPSRVFFSIGLEGMISPSASTKSASTRPRIVKFLLLLVTWE
jgi:hypothetical protein